MHRLRPLRFNVNRSAIRFLKKRPINAPLAQSDSPGRLPPADVGDAGRLGGSGGYVAALQPAQQQRQRHEKTATAASGRAPPSCRATPTTATACPHEEYVEWQRECLRAMLRVLTPDGAIFYNHKWRVQRGLLQDRSDIMDGFPVRQIIIWQRSGGLQPQPWLLPPHL